MKEYKSKLQVIPYDIATKRKIFEKPNNDQSPFQVDIGRITFSEPFRLLDSKTQVILKSKESDVTWCYRSRRDHTDEVAYTAERTAENLGLNSALAKAIALAHDLGHSPFGHSGERTLDKKMKQYGESGFDHDLQTVRIIEKFGEIRISQPGLNLTSQIINDLTSRSKRENPTNQLLREGYPVSAMSLEGQVVEFADKLTFIVHDLEDLISLDMISCEKLCEFPLLQQIFSDIQKELKTESYENLKLRLSFMKKKKYNFFLDSVYKHCNLLMKYINSVKSKQPNKK